MRTVILESPLKGNIERNTAYAKLAMRDSLNRGEAPFASHLLYTQVLDDTIPHERDWGIEAGLALGDRLEATVLYTDLGITEGMQWGIERAQEAGRPIEKRSIRKEWAAWQLSQRQKQSN